MRNQLGKVEVGTKKIGNYGKNWIATFSKWESRYESEEWTNKDQTELDYCNIVQVYISLRNTIIIMDKPQPLNN